MEKEVVTPVQGGTFLHSQATTISLISGGGVCILFLHLKWLVEELTPQFPRTLHQLMANTMVHHLEEPPLPTCLVHLPKHLFSEDRILRENMFQVNDGNVNMIMIMVMIGSFLIMTMMMISLKRFRSWKRSGIGGSLGVRPNVA